MIGFLMNVVTAAYADLPSPSQVSPKSNTKTSRFRAHYCISASASTKILQMPQDTITHPLPNPRFQYSLPKRPPQYRFMQMMPPILAPFPIPHHHLPRRQQQEDADCRRVHCRYSSLPSSSSGNRGSLLSDVKIRICSIAIRFKLKSRSDCGKFSAIKSALRFSKFERHTSCTLVA